MGSSVEQWRKLLHQCLAHRIDPNKFGDLANLLFRRCPISETALLHAVLECRTAANIQWDPLVPLYIHTLGELGKVRVPGVLNALLNQTSITDSARTLSRGIPEGKPQKLSTLMTDTRIIQDAIISLSSGSTLKSTTEAMNIYVAIARWITVVIAWHSVNVSEDQAVGGLMSSPDAISLFESLGILLAAVSGTEKGVEALSAGHSKALRTKLGQALSAYLPLCAGLSLPLRNRLDSLQKDFNLYGEVSSKPLDVPMIDSVNVSALQLEASVMDSPIVNSRAGLYIYINALLVGRPLVDDRMLVNYLSNRYGGHYEILVEELITAAFDVLSNAMYRNESNQTMFVFRSFLVNKLPPFLASMAASSMESIPMELCISHALHKVDHNAFPSFSQVFEMQGNSVLSDVRQEFLFACASHRLIPESSIERLLGENPMQTLPVGGQYVKDELVAQIMGNTQRADQLISEIESMEGNSGAIVGAVIEVIHMLCNQRETMTLKTICNSLSRRPHLLDAMLLFRSPKSILQPLCSLLDAWRWDEDQGENQPVYDEFGSILLLVLAFKYRYNLSHYDLGISSDQSFVLKLLNYGFSSQKLEDLSETQHKNLGSWISALFIAEQISEETMSSCSPQEFYLLVATLFGQSVSACEMGKLALETLKGGFEYLLEPFLLPSLIIALTWLGNYIWESQNDPSIPLKVLNSLVKPSSISGEAEAFHRTVLYITAQTLEEQLQDVRTRHPALTEIKFLLDVLEPYLSFQRSGNCRRSDLESWTSNPSSGLLGSIRNTFQSLVHWSTNLSMSSHSYNYSHRQLLAGIRILGSSRVLSAIIDELKSQTGAGSGDLALDIAASIICAPVAESFAVDQSFYYPIDTSKEALPRCPIFTLRDALISQHENVPKMAEKDSLLAADIVRLYRRVNALMTPPSQVTSLDVSNIIDMSLDEATGHEQMGLQSADSVVSGGGVGSGETENINQLLNEAAVAAAAGVDGDIGQNMALDDAGMSMDPSIDDMLGVADMGVGNPEFLDLDIDAMF